MESLLFFFFFFNDNNSLLPSGFGLQYFKTSLKLILKKKKILEVTVLKLLIGVKKSNSNSNSSLFSFEK